tara:strand:+ start:140 stop:973 length:834 start_codon:yes stop_codon:yes gene_type:complete
MGENNSKNINKSSDIMDDKDKNHNLTVDINDINASDTNDLDTHLSNKNNKDIGSVTCITSLIKEIFEKKRKLNLYRKILELKYNKYKKCHNAWSISTILLSSCLTFIESCKLIFLDEENNDTKNFYDLSPILIGSIITCTSSIVKFKKYQEKMEAYSNIIEKCVVMISRIKNKFEMYDFYKKGCSKKDFEELLNNYNEEILKDYSLIYQETQKYIKNTDYDKYAEIINNSELHKHIIESERLKFYKEYEIHQKNVKYDIDERINRIEKCYKYSCCCC